MSRLRQWFDYVSRDPDQFSIDFVKHNYTHFTITPESRKVRRKCIKEKKATISDRSPNQFT
jgi:hypothetical protein